MNPTRPIPGAGLLATVLLAVATVAQDTVTPTAVGQTPDRRSGGSQSPAVPPAGEGYLTAAYLGAAPADGDSTEVVATGGAVLQIGDVEFRAQSVVLSLDREELANRFQGGEDESGPGLPRRRLGALPSKRRNGDALIRSRMAALLRAAGGDPDEVAVAQVRDDATPFPIAGVRHLYLEGDVTLIRGGQQMVVAERINLSPLDDRMVLENATVRLQSAGTGGQLRTLTLRGPRFVRQGARIIGRDVSVTADPAGDPELDLQVELLEVLQRKDEFELVTRDGVVRVQGVPVIPLPSARVFTKNQQPFLLQGFTGGFSDQEGASVRVELGGSLNETGGAMHNLITGRPRGDFRGDWQLGVGWIEKRGIPVSPGATFEATTEDGRPLYAGRIEGFYLNDDGDDFRRITRRSDGSLASDGERFRLFTETRVFLDQDTTLDLTAQRFSDEAVYSEFFEPQYLQEEEPETSLVLRRGRDNRLFLARGRWNLNRSSYDASRSLAPGFTEELPRISYDIFEQPLFDMPWGRPLTITSRSEFAQLRTNSDDLVADPRDETVRIDQQIEIGTWFSLGPVNFRPYSNARFTWYDRTQADRSGGRWAFESGIQTGTRFQRVFSWLDDAGETQKLRHVISPQITVGHVYKVDGDPFEFASFDQTDSLTEGAVTRFTLLNRLQRVNEQTGNPEDLLWLDLVQNVFPISGRDNGGDQLGLLEYELILQPMRRGSQGLDLQLLVEGEHDWNTSRERTFNSQIRIGPILGINWFGGFRTDGTNDGQVDFGGMARIRDRWTLFGAGQYDLENREFLNFLGRITRRDRNWELGLAINYDEVADEVRLRLEFTPLLMGLQRGRGFGFQGGSDQWAPGARQ